MSFGTSLKTFRTSKGISQEELANKVGVHPNHLSRYERGLASPSIDIVQKIAEVLDISLDQLVFGKEQNVEVEISDRELIKLFKQVQFLSSKQKDTVKDLLSAFIIKADLLQKLAS